MKRIFLTGLAMGFIALVIGLSRRKPAPSLRWAGEREFGGTVDWLHGNPGIAVGATAYDDTLAAEGLVDQALGAVRAGLGKSVSSIDEAVRG